MADELPPWRRPEPPPPPAGGPPLATPPPSSAWTMPASAPPAWTPSLPKRHHRRLWIWTLAGALVAIVGLAVASGTLWVQKIKPPIDAANAYLRDLAHSDYDAAFDRLCEAEKVDASPTSLSRTAQALSLDKYDISPFDVNVHGSSATVKVDLNPDNVGKVDRFVRMTLRKQNGDWRPCGGAFGFVTRSATTDSLTARA